MKRLLACAALALTAVAAEPFAHGVGEAWAQSNDDDYTPLNSRIRRERQFPLEPPRTFEPRQLSDLAKRRSNSMVDQLSRCLWNRSNRLALELLEKTDFGFQSFEQIGVPNGEIGDYYPIDTCLYRVASTNTSGVVLRYNAPSMRRWYLREAYLDRYENGPSWIRPGYMVAERTYPLSQGDAYVRNVMNLADCVVLQDPHAADFLFRTGEAGPDEALAIEQIVPSLEPCLPQGQQLELDAGTLRVWLGEALWHASRNSIPATQAAEPETVAADMQDAK